MFAACTHTHTAYQLAVGVNCVGPQGKNNSAPKIERQSVFFHSSAYAFILKTKQHVHAGIIKQAVAYLLISRNNHSLDSLHVMKGYKYESCFKCSFFSYLQPLSRSESRWTVFSSL